MLKIHNRNDIPLFGQVVGVLRNFAHITNQNATEVFITDVGGHDFFTLGNGIRRIQL